MYVVVSIHINNSINIANLCQYKAYVKLFLMKVIISVSVLIFSTIGSWLGALMDKGNWFGGWSILIGFVGAFAGIYIGYIVGRNAGL